MTIAVERPQGGRLVDQFEYGLDAPICLTWELTYACNLACVHCLSSSGRRDPRELSTDECKALIDEFERMQVFYVNIGGGEPTVRPDFWELLDYAVAHHVGVKFSTNGFRITPERAATARGDRLRRRPDLPRRRHRRGQRRGAGPGHLRRRPARHGEPPGRRHEGLQALGRLHPSQHRPARRVQGHRGHVRRPAAADPAAPVGPRRRRLGRAAPAAAPAARALRLAGRQRRPGAHRRLVLPPVGVRPGDGVGRCRGSTCAARAGWSAWSTRSATCTRARSRSTTSSWPATCARTAASTRSGRPRRCSSTCARPRPGAPARSARRTTRAAAAAWPPSSSPASRSTARTRSA